MAVSMHKLKRPKSLLSCFPKKYTPRQLQIQIATQVQEHLDDGIKKIIIAAPTGVGKSALAITLARYLGSSFIVTASKYLQDQYTSDFDILKPVKGKSNFACFQQMEAHSMPLEQHMQAKKAKMTCEVGQCTIKDPKTNTEKSCKFKSSIQDYYDSRNGTICPYYKQKYAALISSHSLWNYSSYFQIIKYNQKQYGEYLMRDVAIFDEAHTIEDQIINFLGIEIRKYTLDHCGLEIDAFDTSDVDSIIELLESIENHYNLEIRDLKDDERFATNPNHKLLGDLENNADRFAKARLELYTNRDNFVINKPVMYGGEFHSLQVKPLDISKYAKKFFVTPIQVYMSATIDLDSFCQNMGFDADEVAFVEASRSPFLLQNRKVDFLNVGFSAMSAPRGTEYKIIRTIDDIMTRHADQRGLVLTSSKSRCTSILNNLSPKNAARIRICHATNAGGRTQKQILQEHESRPASVLLSSSLWQGVDLRDDLSRFQIIAKAPFLNPTENWVAGKHTRYPLWSDSQVITKILQGMGRSVRNENDYAVTYVLDSHIQNLLEKRKKMVPRAYHDSFGWAHAD